jgi:hypothetical protein
MAQSEIEFTETNITSGGTMTITRTWSATDDFDHTTTKTQVITVVDEEAPKFSDNPADMDFECSCDLSLENGIDAIDNCDANMEPTYSETRVNSTDPAVDGYMYKIARFWSATDNSGNNANMTQTVTVKDTLAPIITVKHVPTYLACTDLYQLGNADIAAFDECSNAEISCGYGADGEYINKETLAACDDSSADVYISFTNSSTVITDCSTQYVRSWTATDAVGNAETIAQTTLVEDSTYPTWAGADDACLVDNGMYVKFEDITTHYLSASDDCTAVADLVVDITMCNSTNVSPGAVTDAGFTTDCHYNAAEDALYILGTEDSVVYQLYFTHADSCGNTVENSLVFDVVFDSNLFCAVGTHDITALGLP